MDASQTQLNQPGKSQQSDELVADPSRLALSLFKGIDYQIWQTVLAWIDLGETDGLVVEGAEDFGTISQSLATAHQVKNLASPRFNQVVGDLRLAIHPDSKPALLYVGLCGLVTDVGFATNMMLSHEALAKLTRKKWLARLSAPFELNCPRITVPAIKAACESGKKGLALAATILLAAGDAVSVTKATSNLIALQKLAGEFVEKGVAKG
jgi:hypothetical protein